MKQEGSELREREKVLLVALINDSSKRYKAFSRFEELEGLVKTAGGEVFEKVLQIRDKVDSSYYVGKGKALDIKEIVQSFKVDTVLFDTELTPAQQRNLENLIGTKIIDRNVIIMDIFALHARTREAKIQVELAQLKYRLPRLTGYGVELSRLGGGIGTRGPGEKKLEVERRRIKERIQRLERELKFIEKTQKVQSKRRRDIFKIALVGYTNAGKSTLMNMLTKQNLKVEDSYFSTLEATTRKFYIGERFEVVVSDTVGFIEDLPPYLVASFRSTLQVATDADLLLHVVDVSLPGVDERIRIVNETLKEIGCERSSKIIVLNKIDLVLENTVLLRYRDRYEGSILLSAISGEGLDDLKKRIKEYIVRTYPRRFRFKDV